MASGRKFCGEVHEKNCVVCGKIIKISSPYRFDKVRTCSKKCGGVISHSEESKQKRKQNSLDRYGVEAPQQLSEVKKKAQATNVKRYGANWPNQNSSVREKGYKTNEERYGVRHPLQNEDVKAKASDTLQERFGVSHPSYSPELRERLKARFQELYGTDHPFQSEEVKQQLREYYLKHYGKEYPSQVPEIKEKMLESYAKTAASGGARIRVSKLNLHWKQLIEDLFKVTVKLEYPLAGKSFDLAIPEKKLLIEINPTVTHNSQVSYVCLLAGCDFPCANHKAISQSQHQQRAKLAKAHGMSLVQIYDWDTEESILRLLAGKLKTGFTRISSRKLDLRKISANLANEFLAANHIQGGMKGQLHAYGLFNAEELLAVATFGAARFGSKAEFEWLRYAVKADYIVHGASNRLFQAFLADAKPKSVVSYVDFDHSTALELFLSSCGFIEKKPTSKLIWSKKKERVFQTSVLRLGADRLLNTAYGSESECGLDNTGIMLAEGWLPVYTAGNRVFQWNN